MNNENIDGCHEGTSNTLPYLGRGKLFATMDGIDANIHVRLPDNIGSVLPHLPQGTMIKSPSLIF